MRAEVNGIQLHYLENGDPTNETVVFVHGLGATLDVWYPQAKLLEDSYHILRYDIRGAGLSEKPEEDYSLSLWSDDLAGLLDHVGAERAHIVGHSLGAMIALRFALEHRRRVLSFVLAGGLTGLSEEGRKEMQKTMNVVKEKGLEPTVEEEELKLAFAPRTAEARPEIIGLQRALSLSEDPEAYIRQCESLMTNSLKGEIGKVDVPTLLLVGNHDVITPIERSREIAAEIEGSRIDVIADAGHMSMIERPRRFAESILTFLSNQ